jgi:hypothetical protein
MVKNNFCSVGIQLFNKKVLLIHTNIYIYIHITLSNELYRYDINSYIVYFGGVAIWVIKRRPPFSFLGGGWARPYLKKFFGRGSNMYIVILLN